MSSLEFNDMSARENLHVVLVARAPASLSTFVEELVLMILIMIMVTFAWCMGAREKEEEYRIRTLEVKNAQL